MRKAIPTPLMLLLVLGVPFALFPTAVLAAAVFEPAVWFPWLQTGGPSVVKAGWTAAPLQALVPIAFVAAVVIVLALSTLIRSHPGQRAPQLSARAHVHRLSSLPGMPLVDLSEQRGMRYITDVLVHPGLGRVLALDCGTTGRVKRVLVSDLEAARIGHQTVVVASTHAAGAPGAAAPMDDCLDVKSLIGLDVFSETGTRLGTIAEVYIRSDSFGVDRYELRGGLVERLLPQAKTVLPSEVLACSQDLMLVEARSPDANRVSNEVHPPAGTLQRVA